MKYVRASFNWWISVAGLIGIAFALLGEGHIGYFLAVIFTGLWNMPIAGKALDEAFSLGQNQRTYKTVRVR